MLHISDRLAQANFIVSGRPNQSTATTASLFAYGTLMLDSVIQILVDRVPEYDTVTLSDWTTVRIPGVIYPGLFPQVGCKSIGRLYTGLTVAEWALLDAFENPEYTLERVSPDPAADPALTYFWRHNPGEGHWSAEQLGRSDVAQYLLNCRRWRVQNHKTQTAVAPGTD